MSQPILQSRLPFAPWMDPRTARLPGILPVEGEDWLRVDDAFAARSSIPVEATYVVPRGLRAQEESDSGQPFSYYGFTLHVFAGQILQDVFAKPRKLLDQPLYFPTAEP